MSGSSCRCDIDIDVALDTVTDGAPSDLETGWRSRGDRRRKHRTAAPFTLGPHHPRRGCRLSVPFQHSIRLTSGSRRVGEKGNVVDAAAAAAPGAGLVAAAGEHATSTVVQVADTARDKAITTVVDHGIDESRDRWREHRGRNAADDPAGGEPAAD
jgi:hypothetical protein